MLWINSQYPSSAGSAAIDHLKHLGLDMWSSHAALVRDIRQSWQVVELIEHIKELELGQLSQADAILSGPVNSAEDEAQLLEVVRRLKVANPSAIYVCNPAMVYSDEEITTTAGVWKNHTAGTLVVADAVCSNMTELSMMTGVRIRDLDDVVKAAKQLIQKGPRIVLVNHLEGAGLTPESHFEMMLIGHGEAWHASWPLHVSEWPPMGMSDNDLTSSLFLFNILCGRKPKEILEDTAYARFEVMQAASDERAVMPQHWFEARAWGRWQSS